MRNAAGPVTFRATIEAWTGNFLLPFIFLGLLLMTAINVLGVQPAWGGAGFLVLAIIAIFEFLLPMLFNWVRVDSSAIQGSLNGKRFHILWREILAAWEIEQDHRYFLCLGTVSGTAIFSLRFMPAAKIWQEVTRRVDPQALEPAALQRLPDFREWSRRSADLVEKPFPPAQVVDHWIIPIVGWGALSLCLFSLAALWSAGRWEQVLILSLLCLFAVLVIASWGVTTVDSQGVTRRTMTGAWHIRWDEVQRAEIDPLNAWMCLEGHGKRVALSGPALWIGPAREEIVALLRAQAEYRGFTLRRSFWALLKFTWNAKLKVK